MEAVENDVGLRRAFLDTIGTLPTAEEVRRYLADEDDLKRERLIRVQVPDYQIGSNFGWNSKYWQEFGAPWGGVFSAPEDFARICQLLLDRELRELWTADRDFSRFPDLRTSNPLV